MLSNQSHSKKSQPKEDPIVASDAVAPDIIAPDIIASDSFVPTKETPIEASDLVPESVCSEPVETVADTVASLEDATGAHDHLPVTSTVGEIPSEKDSEETSSQTNVDSDSSDTLVLADNVGTENVCAPPDQADQCISSSHLEQRMGNIAGRTSGRGSGRGRGRAPSRERRLHQLQPISSNRTISAPSNPKMDKELPWRMGSVFSKKEDILRAYNAVVYMVELQKSIPPSDGATCNTDRIIRLHNALQEIKSACDASKLLMPKSNEICASIDLLNDTADDYALLLKNYREKQYLLECKLCCSIDD